MARYKSILQKNTEECFFCKSTRWLEWHHIFNASNKKHSEKYGMMIRVCHWCHNEPPLGIHHNKGARRRLQRLAQTRFENVFRDLNFIEIFGRNYKGESYED